jgi:hypothetical protein
VRNIIHSASYYSVYFAPRGRERLLFLGDQISFRHLTFGDCLIGIIGAAGSGKSSLIKGMFPGLELVNDDDSFDSHRVLHITEDESAIESAVTFHLDMRFQTAFTQMYQIVFFVKKIIEQKKRIIIEHFDLLYPHLKINADILIGIGEEIIVTRPGVFGPLPRDIYDIVHNSSKFRIMLHTAEDITAMILEQEYHIFRTWGHSDVRRGFVMEFSSKPDFSIKELSQKVTDLIDRHLDVAYYDENHIQIGNLKPVPCSGPRLHVKNTSEIEKFRLLDDFTYDRLSGAYSLVGLVGSDAEDNEDLNRLHIF